MTEEGFPETADEIQAAVKTEEFRGLYRDLLAGEANPNEYPTLYETTLRRIRRRFGDRITDGLVEWLKDGVE